MRVREREMLMEDETDGQLWISRDNKMCDDTQTDRQSNKLEAGNLS